MATRRAKRPAGKGLRIQGTPSPKCQSNELVIKFGHALGSARRSVSKEGRTAKIPVLPRPVTEAYPNDNCDTGCDHQNPLRAFSALNLFPLRPMSSLEAGQRTFSVRPLFTDKDVRPKCGAG